MTADFGVIAIAAGDFLSCALTSGGRVKCWGEGMCDFGGSNTSACSTPTDVAGLTSGISAIGVGSAALCAVSSSGGVTCVPGLGSGVTAIALGFVGGRSRGDGGSDNGCALTTGGGVKCWGSNFGGQLGNGSKTPSASPVDVVGLSSGVKAIVSGAYYSCAITGGGGVKCWGKNYFGTLGEGSTTERTTPVDVVGLTSGVTAISAGVYHACAVLRGGVKCWGSNVNGRLGNPSAPRTSPKPVDVVFTSQRATKPPATPTAGSTAVGRCSKAEARRLVERLRLGNAGDPDVTNPVAQALCGAFVGPGSQAMVASLAIPSCGRTAGWVVFQRAGGAWRLVLQRNNGAELDAVGTGIRETQFVLRPGDAHCFPTGGTRSRTWRWNGTRFTVTRWRQTTPPEADPTPTFVPGFFKTPSGNIVCYHSPGPKDMPRASVACGIKSGLKPAPPRGKCEEGGYADDRVTLLATGRVEVPSCAGDPGALTGETVARVLAYGQTRSGGGIRCTSAATGLTCRNTSGHGFFLSRERWRAF